MDKSKWSSIFNRTINISFDCFICIIWTCLNHATSMHAYTSSIYQFSQAECRLPVCQLKRPESAAVSKSAFTSWLPRLEVLLFELKYRLGHPEINYFFNLRKSLLDQSIQKIFYLNLKKQKQCSHLVDCSEYSQATRY